MTNHAPSESHMKSAVTVSYLHEGLRLSTVTSRFPGGEVHVRVNLVFHYGAGASDVILRADLRSSDAIMELLMVTDAVRRQLRPDQRLHLEVPYLPYARQDRVCSPGEALSLRVMCDLINAQRYDGVTVWDPHSDVAGALLDRLLVVSQAEILRQAQKDRRADFSGFVLVAPDAGALKKVGAVAQALNLPYVRADKTRDPATGAITGTVLVGELDGSSDVLIVDDICDGGRTFIELAKVLREKTAGNVALYVTHGIFSKGLEVFDRLIDTVYVANPFIDLPAREAWQTQFRQI